MAKNQWYTELVNLNTKGGSKEIADWFYKSDNRKNIMFFRELPKELHSYYLSICNELESQREGQLTQGELNIIKDLLLNKVPDEEFYFTTYLIVATLNTTESNTFTITNDFLRKFLEEKYETALEHTLDGFLFGYIDIGSILTVCTSDSEAALNIMANISKKIKDITQDRNAKKSELKALLCRAYSFYNEIIINIFDNISSEKIENRLITNFHKYFDIKFLEEIYSFDISNFSLFFKAAFEDKISVLDRQNEGQRRCIKGMIKILLIIITDSFKENSKNQDELYYYLYDRLDRVPNVDGCTLFGKSYKYRHDTKNMDLILDDMELGIITEKLFKNGYNFSDYVKTYIKDHKRYDRDTIIWSLTHSKSLFSRAMIMLEDFNEPKPKPGWFPGSNPGAALGSNPAAPPAAPPAPPAAPPAPPAAPPAAPPTAPPAPPTPAASALPTAAPPAATGINATITELGKRLEALSKATRNPI